MALSEHGASIVYWITGKAIRLDTATTCDSGDHLEPNRAFLRSRLPGFGSFWPVSRVGTSMLPVRDNSSTRTRFLIRKESIGPYFLWTPSRLGTRQPFYTLATDTSVWLEFATSHYWKLSAPGWQLLLYCLNTSFSLHLTV